MTVKTSKNTASLRRKEEGSLTFIIACAIAIISTTAFVALWFWVVRRELRSRTDTVNSARSQLAACRKQHLQARDGSEEQDAKSILSRSLDIYRQSVILYNQTLCKPQNRIPAFLMGFRSIKEGENS